MKIVINKCYGGFEVSKEVYAELKLKWDNYGYLSNEDFEIKSDNYYEFRKDKRLISAIEKVGLKKSSGSLAELKIVEIPDDIKWKISEYDGIETIHEEHRSW